MLLHKHKASTERLSAGVYLRQKCLCDKSQKIPAVIRTLQGNDMYRYCLAKEKLIYYKTRCLMRLDLVKLEGLTERFTVQYYSIVLCCKTTPVVRNVA